MSICELNRPTFSEREQAEVLVAEGTCGGWEGVAAEVARAGVLKEAVELEWALRVIDFGVMLTDLT